MITNLDRVEIPRWMNLINPEEDHEVPHSPEPEEDPYFPIVPAFFNPIPSENRAHVPYVSDLSEEELFEEYKPSEEAENMDEVKYVVPPLPLLNTIYLLVPGGPLMMHTARKSNSYPSQDQENSSRDIN